MKYVLYIYIYVHSYNIYSCVKSETTPSLLYDIEPTRCFHSSMSTPGCLSYRHQAFMERALQILEIPPELQRRVWLRQNREDFTRGGLRGGRDWGKGRNGGLRRHLLRDEVDSMGRRMQATTTEVIPIGCIVRAFSTAKATRKRLGVIYTSNRRRPWSRRSRQSAHSLKLKTVLPIISRFLPRDSPAK